MADLFICAKLAVSLRRVALLIIMQLLCYNNKEGVRPLIIIRYYYYVTNKALAVGTARGGAEATAGRVRGVL